jgi:hypothetical protein
MKRIAIFSALVLSIFSIKMDAQNISDALRFSSQNYGGTARSMGAGNALGALGADFSVLSTNPAGLASYRTSEFVFTPAYRFTNTKSNLKNGASTPILEEQKRNLHIDNVGIVVFHEPRNGKWTSANYAFGFNQLANFSQRTYYEGASKGSILNSFFDEAKSVSFDSSALYGLGAGLAVQTNALYFQGGDTMTTDFSATPNAIISRSHDIIESGRMNEMVFSFAGNYENHFSLGATIGVPFFNYSQRKVYQEADPNGEVEYFDQLRFDENLKTEGIGVNLKIGAIYRVNQMFRVGAAFHSPTYFTLTDNFDATFQYDYTDGAGSNSASATGTAAPFDYGFRNPWRAIGSAAVLIPKVGFVSADVEYVDYSTGKFNLTRNFNDIDSRNFESDLNKQVNTNFGSAVNLRLGGEVVLDRVRLRAGYNLFGTAFSANSTKKFPNSAISLGIGIRKDRFYCDLGYRFSKSTENFSPYATANGAQQTVATSTTRQDALLTFGFKF